MKFFVDTANVADIKKANDLGVICGVTTNPSLIAKEGRDFTEVIKEITSIVDGPISGEVKATTTDAEGMINEGREIASIHPNMVVKDSNDSGRIKSSKGTFNRRDTSKRNINLLSKSGNTCCKRRCSICITIPWKIR